MLNTKAFAAISITLSLMLGLTPLSASASNKQTFNTAYIKYQNSAKKGDWDSALSHARTAYETGTALYSDAPETIADLSNKYGLALLKTGSHTAAVLRFEEALSIFEASYGKDAPEIAKVLMNISAVKALEKGQEATVLDFQRRAEVIVKTEYGAKSIEHADNLLEAGNILMHTSEKDRADRAIQKAMKYYSSALGEESYETAKASYALGKLQLLTNQSAKAKKSFEAAVAALEARGAGDDIMLQRAQSFLSDMDNGYKAIVSGD